MAANDHRARSMVNARGRGETIDEIANEWGLTRERVRQIIRKYAERRRRQWIVENVEPRNARAIKPVEKMAIRWWLDQGGGAEALQSIRGDA